MDLKNILVATDFSNEAYGALYYATQLLASKPCTFHIINIYDDLTSSNQPQKVLFIGEKELTRLRTTSVENLTKTAHKIALDTGNTLHKFNIISSRGTITSVISQTIDDLQIDLIVLGNKGKTGAKEIFMGSNTIRVANTILQCPILAIPKEIAYVPQHEIAFVTDFEKGCSRRTLAPLLFLSSISKAAVKIIHILEGDRLSSSQVSNKKLLEITLAEVSYSFLDLVEFTNKAKVIQSYISKEKISMLAMAYQRRKFFDRLFHEPLIKDLSIYAQIPFLILPIRD